MKNIRLSPVTCGPWVRTHSKLFSYESILTVYNYRAQSNEICRYGRVSRELFPRVRRYGLLYLRTVEYDQCHTSEAEIINSLWPSDAIWWQRSGSTLAQVMACCLTAPSHNLNQCWLIISKLQWHSSECNFTRDAPVISHWNHQSPPPTTLPSPSLPQQLLLFTSKPFQINLRYLQQRKYRSVEMYWITFLWPCPKVTAVVMINKKLFVCRI